MNKTIPSKKWLVTGALVALLSMGGTPAFAANDVLAMQNALYGAGYDIGSADGQMGPSTRSALEAFQKDQPDLNVTGKLDDATKEALGMVSVKVAAASTTAAAPAKPKAKNKAKAEPKAAEPESDDAVEDDDDGGWLFF